MNIWSKIMHFASKLFGKGSRPSNFDELASLLASKTLKRLKSVGKILGTFSIKIDGLCNILHGRRIKITKVIFGNVVPWLKTQIAQLVRIRSHLNIKVIAPGPVSTKQVYIWVLACYNIES